jgi:hypothetical protein
MEIHTQTVGEVAAGSMAFINILERFFREQSLSK